MKVNCSNHHQNLLKTFVVVVVVVVVKDILRKRDGWMEGLLHYQRTDNYNNIVSEHKRSFKYIQADDSVNSKIKFNRL